MKTIKILITAIFLSSFFASSQAFADVCPIKHKDHPGEEFHSVRVYMRIRMPVGTDCFYGTNGQYALPVEGNRPIFNPSLWDNVGYFYWVCGKPHTPGTRETCVFK